jgi:hypothetical protein
VNSADRLSRISRSKCRNILCLHHLLEGSTRLLSKSLIFSTRLFDKLMFFLQIAIKISGGTWIRTGDPMISGVLSYVMRGTAPSATSLQTTCFFTN